MNPAPAFLAAAPARDLGELRARASGAIDSRSSPR